VPPAHFQIRSGATGNQCPNASIDRFQMAYYKLSGGKTAATYESCSTAAFKHGRTETIRSATAATAKACRLFHQSSSSSNDELMSALRECTASHNQLTKEAAMGSYCQSYLSSSVQIS